MANRNTGEENFNGDVPLRGETPLQRSETLEFERFWQVIRTLRGVHGCPWDVEQTTESIKSNLIEEAYETLDSIHDGDRGHLKEELGDVFLVATLMICIEQQAREFTFGDVLAGVADKLIRRHPHVFGEAAAGSPDAVREQWNRIKSDVEGRGSVSALDGVPRSLPPLDRAYKLQKKAAKVGFDWPDVQGAVEKLREEVDELAEALDASNQRDTVEHEIGDVLFSVINVARKAGIGAGDSLNDANLRFSRRFNAIEQYFADRNEDIRSASLEQMEDRWQASKQSEEKWEK